MISAQRDSVLDFAASTGTEDGQKDIAGLVTPCPRLAPVFYENRNIPNISNFNNSIFQKNLNISISQN